jgi:tripartite-type tricarboxylate transporter receptor subunit TctC
MKAFLAWLKKSPEPPAYSSGGNAHPAHLAGVLLGERLGVNLLHVSYKGSAPALTAVASGEVSFGFDFVATSKPMIDAGKLQAFAVMGPKRLSLLPKVPTVDEVGLANAYAYTWGGFFVPAGTPPSVMSRLKSELQKILSSPDVTGHLAFSGVEFDVAGTDDLTGFIRSEQAKWGDLVRKAGMKSE